MADALLIVLDLALVIVVARGGGALALRARQPRIAGELTAVMVLGPTVLGGTIGGGLTAASGSGLVHELFPAAAVDVLTWTGGLGLILYMLLVGMTIDPLPMVRRAGTIALLAASVIGSSAALALVLVPWLQSLGGWQGPAASGLQFTLAFGAGLAANGVPIVARILEERDLLRTDVGALVIASAATITTLALIVAGIAIRGADAAAAGHIGIVLIAALAVAAIALPLARSRWMALPPHVAVAALLVIAVLAGVAGKGLIGTALVGPLIVGIAVRNAGFSADFCERRLGGLVRGALLPVFLGVAALHTNLRELGPSVLVPVAVMVVAVVAVKLAAAAGAARLAGCSGEDARAIGALLQCGGIMTIAVSLDLLAADIISTRMHAALTLVGLVTTLIAGPLLRRRQPAAPPHRPAVDGRAEEG